MRHDTLARMDVSSREEALLRARPDGAAAVFFRWLYLPRPTMAAGSCEKADFDEMVRMARDRLFPSEGPGFDTPFAGNHSPAESLADVRFYLYRQGVCLECRTLIKEADRKDKGRWAAQRSLRVLLALFDREGEPIPKALRDWSARSRLRAPPGKRGRPSKYWLRNAYIRHAVAYLAYATGRPPTRNEATEGATPCDAVVAAFKAEGRSVSLATVTNAWSGGGKGPASLKRWRENAD